MYVIILSAIVLLIVIFAFLRNQLWLKNLAAILLVGIIILRDFLVDVYFGILMQERSKDGLWTEEFRDGARGIIEYSQSTRVILIIAALLLLLLYFRDSRSVRSKVKES